MSLDQVDAETPHEPLVVVPFASSRSPSPFRPPAPAGLGLARNSVALGRAVRSVARSRLVERVGQAPTEFVEEVAILVSALIGGPTSSVPPSMGHQPRRGLTGRDS
jgi:mRNA-degrading endonuclease toxin of MazEF toxin-antitoxin module